MADLKKQGRAGLNRWGGHISEEWLSRTERYNRRLHGRERRDLAALAPALPLCDNL